MDRRATADGQNPEWFPSLPSQPKPMISHGAFCQNSFPEPFFLPPFFLFVSTRHRTMMNPKMLPNFGIREYMT